MIFPRNKFSLGSSLSMIIALLLFSSCSTSSLLQRRGGYMLARYEVKADRPEINTDDLKNFAQPKPNAKFLGLIRPGVWIWDAASAGRDNGTKRWIRDHMGRRPVLLDSSMVDNSMRPMLVYLNNKGYFGADISRKIRYRRARAFVTYYTHTPEPYTFGNINYDIRDDSLRYFIARFKSIPLIQEGSQYDAYKLRDERERLAREIKETGYFNFSREYISFEIDTVSTRNQKANVKIIVAGNREGNLSDSMPDITHQRYFVNKVYIHSNYGDVGLGTQTETDTVPFYRKSQHGSGVPSFFQIYQQRLRLRPIALSRSVFVSPGKPFSQQNINLTYNHLQNMEISRLVSVSVNPPENYAAIKPPGIGLLDYDIRLVRNPVNIYTIEAEGTNAGGYVGLGSSISYRNRNIFKGGETLRFKVRGAFEVEPTYAINPGSDSRLFNSFEAGFESGIDFPSLLMPFTIKRLEKNALSKTTISFGLNFQERTLYKRYVTYLSFGYEWKSSPEIKHIFAPVELSSISITRDSTLNLYLSGMVDPRLLNQYTDHLILALKYSFIFNNQDITTSGNNFFFFRMNMEPAGNLLNLYSNMAESSQDSTGKYQLFGLAFAQYFRTDLDFRYYRVISREHKLVYRFAFGIGVPYGNSTVLPFEKGFFAGGANGLRGWPLRSVGPGEYRSLGGLNFERVGDLWLELNTEYRFPIYSFLDGALYADAGNIWLLNENEDFPGGKFKPSRLLKSMALDAGLGIRFDFNFFIFRIDSGFPLYDPGKPEGRRWAGNQKFQLRDFNWNFGIGYPF